MDSGSRHGGVGGSLGNGSVVLCGRHHDAADITAEQACYIPGYGMQAAASTLAGNSLGENNADKFRQVTKLITAIAVVLMTITGLCLFLFPGFMMSIFTSDAEVINGGIRVLRIVAVSEPVFAALIILEGIFNGIGDTKAPFFFSILSMWGVRIAGTCLCLFLLDTGPLCPAGIPVFPGIVEEAVSGAGAGGLDLERQKEDKRAEERRLVV